MIQFEFRKIILAIISAILIIKTISFIANLLYRPNINPPRGYVVNSIESSQITFPKELTNNLIDIKKLMSEANSAHGKKIAQKCISCHSFAKNEKPKIGTNLWNIVNLKKASPIGANSNYKFSLALKKIGGIWDIESLFKFLQHPSKFAPGTKMAFPGIKSEKDIIDLISYLKTLKDL